MNAAQLMVESIGVGAWLSNVAGNLMLARKLRSGWWVRIVSIMLWFIYGWQITSIPMVLNAVTFFGVNCYGLWAWRAFAHRSGVVRTLQICRSCVGDPRNEATNAHPAPRGAKCVGCGTTENVVVFHLPKISETEEK